MPEIPGARVEEFLIGAQITGVRVEEYSFSPGRSTDAWCQHSFPMPIESSRAQISG